MEEQSAAYGVEQSVFDPWRYLAYSLDVAVVTCLYSVQVDEPRETLHSFYC